MERQKSDIITQAHRRHLVDALIKILNRPVICLVVVLVTIIGNSKDPFSNSIMVLMY